MAARKSDDTPTEPAELVGDDLTKINQDAAAAAVAAELAAQPVADDAGD